MRRRGLLLGGLGAGGLLVGWGLLPPRSRLGSVDRLPWRLSDIGLNGWIRIDARGHVQLSMPKSEMGQGVHTALLAIAADELDMPMDKMEAVQARPDKIFGNVALLLNALPLHPDDTEPGHESEVAKTSAWLVRKVARELGVSVTGGSSSVADTWDALRLAAATARAQLLGAASIAWRLPVSELLVRDGLVSHPSGSSAHYGELARTAAATPPGPVVLKEPAAWRLIGRSVPRVDLPAKTDGRAVFGLDVRPPGLLYAAVRQCPVLGGSPGQVDVRAAMQLPGVDRVVRLGPYGGSTAGFAVVGRSSWHAQRGAQALAIEWRPPPAGAPDTGRIAQALEAAARHAADTGGGWPFHRSGDVALGQAAATRQHEALYHAPYLAHAAMEPINCTARVHEGRVDVWAPTQVPDMARAIAAQVAGVDLDSVTLHVTALGGGFGRRLEVDVIGQAVRVAIETAGRPVQLLWSREEDLMHDFYRPAAVAVMRAGLDDEGRVTVLQATSAGDAITPRWLERTWPLLAMPVDTPDKSTSEGLFDLPYAIGHQRIAHVATHSGVPVGFWRSVGHSHNAFFSEAFIDELASEARQDPVDFRLSMLSRKPRHAAVLRLAAAQAGWGRPLPMGRAQGVALHESFGSIVAQVVELSIEAGRPRVHRVVCAADIGTVVNPGIVAQQMDGGVLFGLGAALEGRIDIDEGVVRQSNFPSHPVLRMAQAPRVETHLIASTRPPAGVGEIGVPPVAPAVANAMFVLTGVRARRLPLLG